MKYSLIAVGVAAFGLAATAQVAAAAIVNPDNDSAAFFAYDSTVATAAQPQVATPRVGEISADGLFLYANSERGWVHRSHSFALVAGQLVHTTDCLRYNEPKPLAAIGVAAQLGPFADHGV